MIFVFQMSPVVSIAISGDVPEPDALIEPRAHENWFLNDTSVRAYIQSKCAPSEVTLIEDCKTAKDAWSILSSRHKMQGPISQVTMIQEAFPVRYSSSVPFADITTKLRDLNKRIWDMGTPTSDSFQGHPHVTCPFITRPCQRLRFRHHWHFVSHYCVSLHCLQYCCPP
jgi:hypothetical protein